MIGADSALFILCGVGNSVQDLNKRTKNQTGLSLVQWCVLRKLIDRPGSSAHSLAVAVGIHPSTLTQTLRGLSQLGLVIVTGDPKDSRRKTISITRDGVMAMMKASELIVAWESELEELRGELETVGTFLKTVATRFRDR